MPNQFMFVNFFATELVSAVQVGDTILNIPPDAAMSMPAFSSGFDVPLTLWDGQNPPEIVWCEQNLQTGQLTVIRAKEGTSAFAWAAGTQVISSLTAAVINAALLAYNTGLVLMANYLPLSGGNLSGPLTLAADPVANMQAATKQYVDGLGTGFMPLSGGTFIGDVSMSGHKLLALPTPTTGSEPATKAYADAIQANADSYAQDVSGVYTTTGTGAAYAISPGKYGAGLTDGLKLSFRLHATSRTAPTLAVDGTAAVPLRTQTGVNESSGTWPGGMVMSAEYRASGPEWLVFGNSMPLGTVATAGGTLAYLVTTGLGLTVLEDGIILQIQVNAGNTGAMTLNVDGLGAVPLRPYTGVDFKAGQVKQYAALLVRYNNATAEWLAIDQTAPRLDQCVDVALAGLTAGQSLGWNGTTWVNQRNSPRGYIDGAVLSNDIGAPNTVIDVAAGLCRADDDTVDIQVPAMTKSIGTTFVAGSGNGGLDTGAVANSTWYAVYAIYNPSTFAVDILISTSFSNPSMPSGFTKKRYIGAIKTDASAHILPFTQVGDDFLWTTPIVEVNNTAPGTTNLVTFTLGGVPAGFKLGARLQGAVGGGNDLIYLSSPDVVNQAPTQGASPGFTIGTTGTATMAAGGQVLVRTNASAQINYRHSANVAWTLVTLGWVDQRGKNA